jgi:ABC-type lipoprotein release transport system permease subunit
LESNAEILELLNTQLVFSWILYTLIYITAGFGIANTLITVVMEKKREIGMLKAMGATRSSILLIFISESTILGTAGVLSGCISGYLLAVLIDAFSIQIPSEVYLGLTTLPVNIEIMNFVYATVFAFIINIIAGVYPANRAAKLDPVDAIENA